MLSGPVQAAEPASAADEFASEIEAELSGGKPAKAAAKPAAAKPDPNLEGWTVDGFLKSIKRSDVKQQPAVNIPVVDAIKDAAKRSASQAPHSAYLDAVSEEAGDLSVNAVDTTKGKGLVRNQPVISKIVYGENLIEIGGREIRNGYITVREGDSLSLIAAEVYGDPMAYDRIFSANQNVLTDPDVVSAGVQLYIPIQ